MSIMLWVTGRVWPYARQRSEAVEHAVLRQLLLYMYSWLVFILSKWVYVIKWQEFETPHEKTNNVVSGQV